MERRGGGRGKERGRGGGITHLRDKGAYLEHGTDIEKAAGVSQGNA